VLLRLPLPLTRQEMLRLSARARQRRVLLLLLRDVRSHAIAWADAPEVTAVVHSSDFVGIANGSGRIAARRIVVETMHRRGSDAAGPVTLWLPSPGGDLRVGDGGVDGVAPRASTSDLDGIPQVAEPRLRAVSQ
jgi:hypothetical protein